MELSNWEYASDNDVPILQHINNARYNSQYAPPLIRSHVHPPIHNFLTYALSYGHVSIANTSTCNEKQDIKAMHSGTAVRSQNILNRSTPLPLFQNPQIPQQRVRNSSDQT